MKKHVSRVALAFAPVFAVAQEKGTMQKINFLNLQGDVMWNLSAATSGYSENRVVIVE